MKKYIWAVMVAGIVAVIAGGFLGSPQPTKPEATGIVTTEFYAPLATTIESTTHYDIVSRETETVMGADAKCTALVRSQDLVNEDAYFSKFVEHWRWRQRQPYFLNITRTHIITYPLAKSINKVSPELVRLC